MKAPVVEFLFHKVAKSDSTSATSNKRILQRVTSDFLQRATSTTSNQQILQRATSNFLQRATSATSNEQILQRATSDFLQRATSATSNERILQGVTSDFTSSNEQRVNFNEYRATSEKLHLIRIGIKFNLISIQKNIKLFAALVC